MIEPVDDAAPDIVGEGVGVCSELGRAEDVDMPDATDDEDDDAHAVRSAESDFFGVGDPLSLGSDEEEVTVETLEERLGDAEYCKDTVDSSVIRDV